MASLFGHKQKGKLTPQQLQHVAEQHKSYSITQFAEMMFQQNFGYAWDADKTAPPDAASPANIHYAERDAQPAEMTKKEVDDFLLDVINDEKLPNWLSDPAAQDLLAWGEGVAFQPTQQKWKYKYLNSTYAPPDVTQGNAVKTNAVLLFITSQVKTATQPALVTEMCYVGVYYDIKPPVDSVKAILRKGAYKEADKITGNKGPPTKDDAALAKTLAPWSEGRFKGHFQYAWGADPPDFTPNAGYKKVSTEALLYTEDGSTAAVEDFVASQVLKGVDLPEIPGLKEKVTGDIVTAMSGIVDTDADRRTWDSIKFDQKYHDPQGALNSLRVSGEIAYYTISLKLWDKDFVKIAYLTWTGEIYSKIPILTEVYNDLIVTLFNNLNDSMAMDPPKGAGPDRDGLIALLAADAPAKFQTTWGYAFKGNKTKPTDSNGDEVYGVSVFGEFKDEMPPAELEKWSADNIFIPGAFSFFESTAGPELKANFDKSLTTWLKESTTLTEENDWGIMKYAQALPDPADSGKSLQATGTAFFANGAMQESGFSVATNIIQFVGVFYVADCGSDSSGGGV